MSVSVGAEREREATFDRVAAHGIGGGGRVEIRGGWGVRTFISET